MNNDIVFVEDVRDSIREALSKLDKMVERFGKEKYELIHIK